MNLRMVRTIFAKELRDMLRDKRTVVILVGLPIVLYPALFLFASQAAIIQLSKIEKTPSRVAIADNAVPLTPWLEDAPMVTIERPENPEQALNDGSIDAYVTASEGMAESLDAGRKVEVAVQYDITEPASTKAMGRVTEVLQKERDRLLDSRLEAIHVPRDYITPLNIQSKNTASPIKTTGTMIGMILPVLIITMLGLGAFYPALDLTAGEKERGTFETLLSTPAGKLDIVAGKFLTVFSLSVATGGLNLVSMGATFALQWSQLQMPPEMSALDIQLPPGTLLILAVILTPLALFISALMMSLAMFARNLKEAEYYVTPFVVVTMFPAILAVIPGTELTRATQFIPIANVALLFKELMIGTAPLQSVFAVLLSTTVYAVLALLLATWLFQREELVLSEERGIPFTFRRSLLTPRSALTPGMALTLLTFVLLLLFYVGSPLQAARPYAGLLVTQWVLFLLPTLALLWYVRVSFRTAISLRLPPADAFAGTLLIAASWVILAMQASYWHNRAFPMPDEMAKSMEGIFTPAIAHGPALMFFVLAVSPAICEEVLFRGAVLSGLRQKLPPWAAILVVGVLFGLFHLVVYRILVAALSGLVLTYVVVRSGSIFTGMIVHLAINGFGVLLVTKSLPDWVSTILNPESMDARGVPGWILAIALIVFASGVALLERSERRLGSERISP